MIQMVPTGRNYKVGCEVKYFGYLDTIKEEDKEYRIRRLEELGFEVRCEKSRSKKKPGINLFGYLPETMWDFKKKEAMNWKLVK